MMTSRGFARISPGIALQNQIRAPVRSIPGQVTSRLRTSSPRQFSTRLRSHGTLFSPKSRIGFLTGSRIGAAGILSSQSILLSSRRFRSTDTTTSPTSTAASELSADNVNPGNTSFSDLDNVETLVDQLSPIEDISGGIGYLARLGLDYGRGPTAVCEWGMEHFHFTFGMPWWAAIIGFSIGIRAVMFYPGILGQQSSAKSQELNRDPVYKAINEKFKLAAFGGNHSPTETMQLKNQISYMRSQAGVKISHMALPLLQAPFAFGMYKLTRAMAILPVPGLDAERMLWISDFTIPDPLFLLPCVSCAMMVFSMRLSVRFMDSSTAAVGKIIPWVIGPLMLVITSFLPAFTQFYFAVAGFLQWGTARVFFFPEVRKYLGLPPLIPRDGQSPSGSGPQYLAPRTRTVATTAVEHAPPAPPADKSISSLFKQAKKEVGEMFRSTRARMDKEVDKMNKEQEEWRKERETEEYKKRRAEHEQQYEERKAARKQRKQR